MKLYLMHCNWKSRREVSITNEFQKDLVTSGIDHIHTSSQAEATVDVDDLGNQAKGLQAHLV